MFAVIFICENLYFADHRETGKIRTRKISRHTVYQTFNKTTFQNPQSTSNCPFVPFLYLTCYLYFSERFERLHSLF